MNICKSKDGFIKIHYKIQQSDLWEDNNALVVFLRMVGYAHYEDNFTSIRFNGKQYYLKRGEFSASVRELADMVNLPIGTLRDVLTRLESDKRISKRSDNRTTIFRICNYAKYQGKPASSPANETTNDPANDPANATEGKKKLKNRKNIDTNVSNKAVATAKTPSKDIDGMFEQWQATLGYAIDGQKQKNRYACSNLLKKYRRDGLTRLIEGVALAQQDKYAPRISDFVSLQAKQNDLIAWGKTKQISTINRVVAV